MRYDEGLDEDNGKEKGVQGSRHGKCAFTRAAQETNERHRKKEEHVPVARVAHAEPRTLEQMHELFARIATIVVVEDIVFAPEPLPCGYRKHERAVVEEQSVYKPKECAVIGSMFEDVERANEREGIFWEKLGVFGRCNIVVPLRAAPFSRFGIRLLCRHRAVLFEHRQHSAETCAEVEDLFRSALAQISSQYASDHERSSAVPP